MKYIKNILLLLVVIFAKPLPAGVFAYSVCYDSIGTVIKNNTLSNKDSLEADSITVSKKNNFLLKKNHTENIPSFFISKKNIDNNDYRYTGNLISYLPFSFLSELGITNHPNGELFYGMGLGSSSLLLNNVTVNNKWNNSLNLNDIRTESISELELRPLTRGFLYNTSNNPVSVNIIESDTFKTKPVSRIRYYQANNEDYIDAMFSAKVYPDLGFSFGVTNVVADAGFTNSKSETWKANVKTIYKLSDKFFVKLNYHHLRAKYGLNGGVNPSSFNNINDAENLTNQIYNRQLAEVFFDDRYNINTINNITLTSYGKLSGDNISKFSFGYENNSNKFKQNEKINNNADTSKISNNNDYDNLYGQFEQNFSFENFNSKLQIGYERISYNIDYLMFKKTRTNIFLWGKSNYKLLNGMLIPAMYGKILSYNNQTFNGYGFDVMLGKRKNYNLIAGYSNFEKPYSLNEEILMNKNLSGKNQTVTTFFTSANINNSFTSTSISYFEIKNNNKPFAAFNTADIKSNSAKIIYPFVSDIVTKGINVNSENKFGNFLYTLNFNYYFENGNDKNLTLPDLSVVTGIYYIDTLYNNNLKLKTGFTFYYGSINDENSNYGIYDFQQMRYAKGFMREGKYVSFTSQAIGNNKNQLDFFLSGRIRNAATFYFVLENLLDNNYYIVPFYPMRERGVRIGLSWDFIN